MGRDGNYWGHNAIIRTEAFAAHCGLPDLRGTPPLGGHILSHDFVEAALMRRAGYAVYMLPTLGGSYEESPPSLIDLSTRDRRWCQGNLQHIRILLGKGFHWASRQHFLTGIFGYLASPLWLVAALRRHRARASGELYPPGIFHRGIRDLPGVAALRRRAFARALRSDHGHSARSEILRPHRRHVGDGRRGAARAAW